MATEIAVKNAVTHPGVSELNKIAIIVLVLSHFWCYCRQLSNIRKFIISQNYFLSLFISFYLRFCIASLENIQNAQLKISKIRNLNF